LLEEHKEFAVKLGVQGTPALWVNDTPVMGANISQIDQILSGRK
jgi:protein-disulfide isomerase